MADPDVRTSPRAAALLFARALQQLDRIQPAAARAPIAAMLEAGIEQCATLRTLLGQPVNHLLDLAQALFTTALRPGHAHPYLSWACWHADHDPRPELHGYCQTNARRYDGTQKTAAQCKFCPAPCTCRCHQEHGRGPDA